MPIRKATAPAAQLPVLYYRAKKGAVHQWRIWVEGDTILTEYGQVGGKQQRTPGKVCKAMNVGMAHERSPEQQAQAVAASMHKFKLDRKYALTPEEATDAKDGLPMLAHRYDERAKHIAWPADLQPKLDGNRANARWQGGTVELVSRSGVDTYDLPHIQAELSKFLPKDCELDGELYVHGVAPQTVNSWCSGIHKDSAKVEYHVYDMPMVKGDDKLPWIKRHAALVDFFDKLHGGSCRLVETVRLSQAQLDTRVEMCLTAGYEGAMLRNLNGLYAWGDRSNDLQKVKVFQDSEFLIVGCTEGVGKMAGCAIWECAIPDDAKGAGQTFTCAMKVPMEVRRQHFKDRNKYIGQIMTVSYFGTFDSGIPRFPRAVKFRDAKDL